MKCLRIVTALSAGACLLAMALPAASQPTKDIRQIYPKMYLATGLDWQGESTQNTCWNKICEDKQGRIWFAGGDHWGTDRRGGVYEGRYDRPWGMGNATVHYYDPKTDKAVEVLELNEASAIFSNEETPGHGKIHADIVCDDQGYLWTGGYLGSSYDHEWAQQYYPKSYAGGAIIRIDPNTFDVDYYGIPNPGGGLVSVKFDNKRRVVHGVTVDRQRYYRLNVETRALKRYDIARFSSREIIVDHKGEPWFPNEFQSLTHFNPDTEKYTDYDIPIPGLRASVCSSQGVIYGICPRGFIWSWDTRTNKVEEYGHVVKTPDVSVYTPNIALDEQLGRLYFMAGGHGTTLAGMPILSILDLKTKTLYWAGGVDVDGCYGAIAASDHTVYFGCYAYAQSNGKRLRNSEGQEYRTNYLVRYDPPKNLEDLK